MSLSGIRLALRIARRDARRTKGRSVLVVGLLAFPVVAIALGATLYDRFELTAQERADRELGTAEAAVVWQYDGPVDQEPDNSYLDSWPRPTSGTMPEEPKTHTPGPDPNAELLAVLPPGSRVVPYASGDTKVKTPDGIGKTSWRSFDINDPIAEGMYEVTDGKAPSATGEVLISTKLADELGLDVGDTLELKEPDRSFKVTGIVEAPNALSESYALGSAATFPGAATKWFVDAPGPIDWATVQGLNELGIGVYSKAVSIDPPKVETDYSGGSGGPDPAAIGLMVMVVGMVILELVLLAGPAFAISAKRRSREYALLAANGATAAQVRRTVMASGVVLGVIAAVCGVVIGCLLATIAIPFMEPYIGFRAGGIRFLIAFTGPLALLAVLTGVLAALVPAFTVARQNVIAALTGRKGVVRSRKRWMFIGIGLVALGTLAGVAGAYGSDMTLLVVAAALGEFGLVMCTPAFVGALSKLGRFLPLSPRIALRDAGRNRASTSPAISAVMAVVAGAIAISAFAVADRERFSEAYATTLPEGTVISTIYQHEAYDESTNANLPLPPDAPAKLATAKALTTELLRQHFPVDTIYDVQYAACVTSTPGKGDCQVTAVYPTDRSCPFDDRWDLTKEQQAEAVANKYCKQTSGGGYYGPGSDLYPGTVIADAALLSVLTGTDENDLAEAQKTLDAGGVIVSDGDYIVDGMVTLAAQNTDYSGETPVHTNITTVSVPGYALKGGHLRSDIFLASSSIAPKLNTSIQLKGIMATMTRVPTEQEDQRYQAAMITNGLAIDWANESSTTSEPEAGSVEINSSVIRPESGIDSTTIATWILAGIAGIVALAATAMATGLAAAEGRKDLSTLAAVGATPGLRRLLALCQSGVISLLGAILGVIAGLGAMFAVISTLNIQFSKIYPREELFPTAIPWPVLGITLIVIPVIAMLGAGLFTRSRLPVERRAG